MPHPRVLIVDDDPVVLKFVQANLQAMDCETLTAVDGVGALQIIGREPLDLMILDIRMPKMDGFEVCQRVREWSRIPVIMQSVWGDASDKVKGLNLGADDYIAKPVGVNELMARVGVVLRRAEDKAEGRPPKSSAHYHCARHGLPV
ncbi:MAG: response regulator [Dehalococcoidales bacterium]